METEGSLPYSLDSTQTQINSYYNFARYNFKNNFDIILPLQTTVSNMTYIFGNMRENKMCHGLHKLKLTCNQQQFILKQK
jgi:hypothetical protein